MSRPQTGNRGGASNSGYGGGAPKQGGGGGGQAANDPPMNMSEKQLMEQFRTKLAARGARGIVGLGKQFKIADDDRSKNLDM